jgi:hypothetical protein
MTPAEIVQGQVDAYNDRDLDRFLAYYSDAITVFRLPSTEPTMVGKARFAEFYAEQRFNRPGLRAEVLARIVLGDKVIDHERIFGVQDSPMEIAAVYEVIEDRIARVWFFPAD